MLFQQTIDRPVARGNDDRHWLDDALDEDDADDEPDDIDEQDQELTEAALIAQLGLKGLPDDSY